MHLSAGVVEARAKPGFWKVPRRRGIVLDLSQTSVTAADLGDVLHRVQGITNQISDVIILPP